MCTPDAGALHHHGHSDRRTRLHVVEGQPQWIADAARNWKMVRGRVDKGDVEVDQEIVHPDRGDGVAEPLKGHPVVPQRQPHLFPSELRAPGDLSHGFLLAHAFPSRVDLTCMMAPSEARHIFEWCCQRACVFRRLPLALGLSETYPLSSPGVHLGPHLRVSVRAAGALVS